MPCYHPIDAWRCAKGIFFRCMPDSSYLQLPCGRCIGCRLERSRQWALRLVHENSFHDDSSFITLTYDEAHLPVDGSLNLKHFQDFMKRFRKAVFPLSIRFFHAGEYGEQRGRPHYHAIIFGFDFRDDAMDFKRSERGDWTWSSPFLSKLWPFGLSRVGGVTFESCAYVARYVTKKVTGLAAGAHYERVDMRTGEVFSLKPEYATMSRRPGIGSLHFDRFRDSIFPRDRCVVRERPCKPPRFYLKQLEKVDPVMYRDVMESREFALISSASTDRTRDRLKVAETVKLAQIGHLTRSYEIG